MTTATVALVQIRGRLFTVDDAISASAVLAEVSAGHEEAAERLACQCGLEGLSGEELEALCEAFGVEI